MPPIENSGGGLASRGSGRVELLSGGGDAGVQIRAFAWAASPLGVPQTWPQSLRIAVRLVLNTRHPMFIFWVPQSTCFFNDAFGFSMGAERRSNVSELDRQRELLRVTGRTRRAINCRAAPAR